jgi:beta-lactam-binding protein with PASTA domain
MPQHSRRIRAGIGVALVILSLAAALAACAEPAAPQPPPATVDLTIDRAVAALRDWCASVSIDVGPSGTPPTADRSTLVVATQEYAAPAGGQRGCAPGVPQRVRLTLTTTVPALDGMTVGQARAALARHGLGLTAPARAPDEGLISGQRPAAGTVVALDAVPLATTRVTVTVAVRVPDVTRAVEGEACAELARARLECSVLAAGNAPAPGLVLTQSPAAGATAEPGATVTLEVLRLESRVVVPTVVGLAEEAACAPVETVKLVCDLRVTVPGDPPGRAVGQAPPGDTVAPAGARVTVQVARVPVQVAVPDLLGLSEDEVCGRLYAAKLGCAPVLTGVAEGVAPGSVTGQRPAAGTSVAVDSPVTVQLSRAAGVRVPDVVGRRPDDACGTLRDARLGCRPRGPASGPVLSQDPPAGALAAPASSVDLLLATPDPGLPWWTFVAAAALALVAGGLVAREARRRRRERRRPGPTVEVSLHTGAATARAEEAREW